MSMSTRFACFTRKAQQATTQFTAVSAPVKKTMKSADLKIDSPEG